jgi:hypothetical protein
MIMERRSLEGYKSFGAFYVEETCQEEHCIHVSIPDVLTSVKVGTAMLTR